MLKAFKFRIYPSKAQVIKLDETLHLCRELYNAALQERRDAWKINRINVTCFDQQKQLPAIKVTNPEYAGIHSQILYDVLKRLDKSFQAFFRRVKRKEKAGFPRFKGKNRFDSFCYPQVSNSAIHFYGNKLSLPKIGKVKIKLSRPIIGKAKTLTLKNESGKWFAIFIIETIPEPLPKTGKQIGIDVGIENFATLSDGMQIDNWKYYESSQKQLRVAQRSIARKKKGSANRKKAVFKLRKIHQKITNKRADFQHKLSTHLVKEFDLIAIEKLNVLGMSKGILSKQIHDASWSSFFNMLRYKAENADKQLIEVSPAYTSQTCTCGKREKKSLAQRQHICSECGYKNHRDIVSAEIILLLGQRSLNLTKTVGL